MDQSLLEMSQALGCDFIILGGYGLAPVLEVLLGSAMDNVLRSAEIPLLICQ
jgi:nucleotide-binding universal stress UspA family protein